MRPRRNTPFGDAAWDNRRMNRPVEIGTTHDYRTRFLQLALRAEALRFGEFTLKSGRLSPYFFNAGRFDSGTALAELAACYVDAVDAAGIQFDLLFGPAYKGIPLGAGVAMELARLGLVTPFAYNRKEAKDHGEGGTLVGAPLHGRVLIVDDVISAGTAVRESIALIKAAGATPHAVAIALDRQEKATENGADVSWSAVQYVRDKLGLQVISIANLAQLLQHLGQSDNFLPHFEAVSAYRARYGVD